MIMLVVLAPVAGMLLLMGMAAIERWQEEVRVTAREDMTITHGERQMR